MTKTPKRPRDPNQLAKMMVDLVTDAPAFAQETALTPSERGRMGGLKGGPARAEKMQPEKRIRVAKKAASARWHQHEPAEHRLEGGCVSGAEIGDGLEVRL